ncbi:MAG: hypothetical protein JWO31_2756 [Phycisphaerales bacterium]|nr:hypothetical protein [Phycisphaerales bacterium]
MEDIKSLADALDLSRLRAARAANPVEKLLAGPRLFDRIRATMLAGIRHQFPGAPEHRVRAILSERLALARRLGDARDE